MIFGAVTTLADAVRLVDRAARPAVAALAGEPAQVRARLAHAALARLLAATT